MTITHRFCMPEWSVIREWLDESLPSNLRPYMVGDSIAFNDNDLPKDMVRCIQEYIEEEPESRSTVCWRFTTTLSQIGVMEMD